MERRNVRRQAPFVSVIMPVRNEGIFIRRSLGAVLTQDYPAERLEVVVADGMSTDGTRDLIAEMQLSAPNLRVIDNPGKIVPTGINEGLRVAQGDVIVRVDGHTIIAPTYVTECVAALRRSGADNVGGRMVPKAEGAFGSAVALATSSPFGVGGARFHYSDKEEWVDTVYLGAWPRAVFERIGFFDEELVRDQDDEFNYRLRKNGGRILLSPRIQSLYYPRVTVRSLWRQYFQYGYWKVRVLQKHPRQMRARQAMPPLFVFIILSSGLLAPSSRIARRTLGSVLGAYAAADVLASSIVAKRHGKHQLRVLPAVFPVLHFSYGAGLLWGLVRFTGRWTDRRER